MRGKRGTRGTRGWRAAAVGLLAVTVATMLAATPSASAAAASGSTAWRFDGYSIANNGFNPNETVITTTTVAGLHNAWSVSTPAPTGCAIQGHPVVSDGRLFLSDPGGIAAYDAVTGAQLWRRDFGDGPDTDTVVAVVDNRLFVAASTCFSASDPDGVLRVLGTASGALRWQVRRDAPMYTLVVDRDTVIVSGSAAADGSDTTAYRVTNGKVRWDRPGTLMHHSVSAAGRLLLENDNTGGSIAVDTVTGAQLWSTTTSYDALAAGVHGWPVHRQPPGQRAGRPQLRERCGAVGGAQRRGRGGHGHAAGVRRQARFLLHRPRHFHGCGEMDPHVRRPTG
jgi:outer membrane protein assembly factor BamB